MASDPVCGMRVLRNEDLKASFKGKTYYFCSANCLEEFRKAPSEFATEG
ncbi:MAG: YHS domain-containing protein [bacterium]|nr:YHS domain-containing protein [bacterium]